MYIRRTVVSNMLTTYSDVEFMIPRRGVKNEECKKNIGLPATIEKSGVL